MAHLCPVRAYADWLQVTDITDGFIFRRLTSGGRVSENNQPMVCLNLDKHFLQATDFLIDCRILFGDVPQQLD
jgi:hypothetical protein